MTLLTPQTNSSACTGICTGVRRRAERLHEAYADLIDWDKNPVRLLRLNFSQRIFSMKTRMTGNAMMTTGKNQASNQRLHGPSVIQLMRFVLFLTELRSAIRSNTVKKRPFIFANIEQFMLESEHLQRRHVQRRPLVLCFIGAMPRTRR